MTRGSGPDDGSRPQLQIWDDEGRETVIGVLEEEEGAWDLLVLVEPVGSDLVRGCLSFRRADERFDTAPVLVEKTAAEVLRRAAELPDAMLRQLLLSVRG